MRNVWLVVKHEFITMLAKRSFWVMTFLMPLVLVGISAYYMIQDSEFSGDTSEEEVASAETTEETTKANQPLIGLVDEAGVVREIPAGIPDEVFSGFPDEPSARAALEIGEIDQYVYIPPDYLATGEVMVYDKYFQLRSSGEGMGVASDSASAWMLRYLLEVNLTGDEELVAILRDPTPATLAEFNRLEPLEEPEAGDQALAWVVASIVPYIYYFIMIIGSSYLLRSVVAEKENRTAEVLLLSLDPRQLMLGKVLGLSLITLLQLVFWLGGGLLILNRSADWLNVANYDFPPGFIVWAVLFLMLGFLLYAALQAAAGALAPNAREGGQITWLLIVPLMPTLMFADTFVNEPHGTLSLVLSFFPFSAPSAMVTRLAVANVPLWQPLVSLLGLAATAYLMVVLAARFFRPGNLLSQTSFSWRRLATEWRR